MELHNSLIAMLGRRYPQLWEVVGGGPGGGIRTRADAVALNPQPLPPGCQYGAGVAQEVVRIATTAHVLKVAFEPGDDLCPPPRFWPPIPFPWPPDPGPWRDHPEFDIDYALGMAMTLAASAHAWQRLDGAAGLERLHDVALETAQQALRQDVQ